MEGKRATYRFMIMIGGSIIIAFILVTISVSLYFSSGTAQLDASRPSLQSVRDQVKPEDHSKSFPSSGIIDDKTLTDFSKLYQQRAKEATSLDAFSSESLSDASLGLDEAPTPAQ